MDLGFLDGMLIGLDKSNEAIKAGKKGMVFDWDKAAQLIKDNQPAYVEAGLSGDWTYTGGSIYQDGKPDMASYTFLASMWATPQIELDGVRQDCFIDLGSGTDWDAGTKWPESALAILNS